MTLITEDQAKTKWCPLTRFAADGNENNAANRWDGWIGEEEPREAADACCCIASGCMAWREGVWGHQRNLSPEDRTPGVGYCGAFGRPT